MSFAKIAEARAVKKIVIWLRRGQRRVFADSTWTAEHLIDYLAQEIEAGKWKGIKLPKAKKK